MLGGAIAQFGPQEGPPLHAVSTNLGFAANFFAGTSLLNFY
jgi:hypothetical protein